MVINTQRPRMRKQAHSNTPIDGLLASRAACIMTPAHDGSVTSLLTSCVRHTCVFVVCACGRITKLHLLSSESAKRSSDHQASVSWSAVVLTVEHRQCTCTHNILSFLVLYIAQCSCFIFFSAAPTTSRLCTRSLTDVTSATVIHHCG